MVIHYKILWLLLLGLFLFLCSFIVIWKRYGSILSIIRENLVLTRKNEENRLLLKNNLSNPISVIKTSPIYIKFIYALDESKHIFLSNDDWFNLICIVDKELNGFTSQLYSCHPMSEFEIRICILTKLDFSPKQISQLTFHDVSSVSSARSRLYKKFFGENGSAKKWDDYIRNL